MPFVTVERTYLELLTRNHESVALPIGHRVQEEDPCDVATYRHIYAEVGRDYHWRDRLSWSDERLAEHLRSESDRIWTLRDAAGIGGFFELVRHTDQSVELAYFGLVPDRHGRGLGRALLTRAIDEGWGWGTHRLWLHTCSLDSAWALSNYVARGFTPFKVERYETNLPDS